jgi:pimeloyl-[acyl-carrier protein] synthase
MDLDVELTRLIQSDPDAVGNPYPLYRELLERAPAYQWGPTVVLSTFADVKATLRDTTTFSNRALSVGSRAESILSGLSSSEAESFREVSAFESMYISRADGDQHVRLRDIAHRAFTPRKMAELNELSAQYTDDLLERLIESGETDLVAGLFSRFPAMMINSLLNVPLEDVDLIKGWTARIGKNRGGAVIADLLDAHAALGEFREYVSEIVEHHRRDPAATNLVSALMGATSDARLSSDELLATMVVLLFAGTDTTTALLGNGLHALLTEREQWDLLCSDPDKHLSPAIEELLRYITPVQTTWRVTTRPVTIGDVDIDAETTVLLLLGAADRDPRVIGDPDRLDIARAPNQHVALGFGPHFCLGSSLARLETRTMLGALAQRFPDLRLRDAAPARFIGNIQFRRIAELDVELGADRGALVS